MRKIFMIALCVMLPQLMKAQTSTDVERSRIDSLESMVDDLQNRVTEAEEQARLQKVWKRSKFLNLAFVTQSLKHQDIAGLKWKSDFGASLQIGRTYYLHSKPIAGMIKFGIDWVQADLNYAKYTEDFTSEVMDNGDAPSGAAGDNGFEDFGQDGYQETGEFDLGCHQFDIAMQVGPSITINPIKDLMVSGYFRYAPTGSFVVLNDEFHGGYASFFTAGGSVAWKAFSLGIEARWGQSKYNSFSFDEDEVENMDETGIGGLDSFLASEKNRMKTSSMRVYISFRF